MPNASYIPKYIMKRFIPADAIKVDKDVVKVKFINVITPISTEKAPKNTKDFIEVKIDGQLLYSKNKLDLESRIVLENKSKKYSLNEIQNMGEGLIAVGDFINIVVPNIYNFKPGETHHIEFDLHIGRGFHMDLERTFQ